MLGEAYASDASCFLSRSISFLLASLSSLNSTTNQHHFVEVGLEMNARAGTCLMIPIIHYRCRQKALNEGRQLDEEDVLMAIECKPVLG